MGQPTCAYFHWCIEAHFSFLKTCKYIWMFIHTGNINSTFFMHVLLCVRILLYKYYLALQWAWRPRHDDRNPWQITPFSWCEMGLVQNKFCCFCSQNRCCHRSWHFCRVNASTHHDTVLRPVANNWLLGDLESRQWSQDNPAKSFRVVSG